MTSARVLKAAILVSVVAMQRSTCAADAATTKGLNQIVTPDIQPMGQLSLSLQYQHPIIGNSAEAQEELGLTKSFEIAVFQGVKPGAQYLSTEYGLIQRKEWLLSVGFLNWSTRGDAPQTFVEGGYYKGNVKLMAGAQRSGNRNLAVFGAAYQAAKPLLLQLDYLSGRDNFLTAGFTYNITPNLQFNPAVYIANASHHRLYPYGVLTWNISAFKG